jgi:hypothetical protein
MIEMGSKFEMILSKESRKEWKQSGPNERILREKRKLQKRDGKRIKKKRSNVRVDIKN